MEDNRSAVILIPARNEEATVGSVVRDARAETGCAVVVIDDASTDSTAEAAQSAGAVVLTLPLRLGAWGAVQTGFRYAVDRGYEIAVTMDADGQHLPSYIKALMEPIQAENADVVIGACIERGSIARHVAWSLFRLTSGIKLRDLTSGFRAYNRSAMSVLASRRATLLDYQDMGVLILLQKAGLYTVETPVEMCPRKIGHSKVFSSWWVVGKYMVRNSILCVAKRSRA